MQKNLNETKKIQEEILNNVTINQNDISNKLEEILAIQDNLMKIVYDISCQDSVGKLEMKLDKYSFLSCISLFRTVGSAVAQWKSA